MVLCKRHHRSDLIDLHQVYSLSKRSCLSIYLFIYLSMCTGSIYFLNKSLENQQNFWYINGHSTLLHQNSLELKIAQHLKGCTKRRGEEFTISVHKGSSSN